MVPALLGFDTDADRVIAALIDVLDGVLALGFHPSAPSRPGYSGEHRNGSGPGLRSNWRVPPTLAGDNST
jgi:hypothetical protein